MIVKNQSIKFIVIFFFILYSFIAQAANKKIILASDYYCPYACTPGSSAEGILVDIARKAFKNAKIDVEYRMMGWGAALEAVANGKIDGILGVSQDEGTELIYPSLNQASSMTAAFVLSDSSWIYDGTQSLRGKKIGVVDGYVYTKDVKSYIYSNYITDPDHFVFSTSVNAVDDNTTKLLSKSIEVYLEDENVINYYLASKNINKVKNAGYINIVPQRLFIAFSVYNPDSYEYANIISRATYDLKKNNEMTTLMKKYNMKDY